MLNRELRRGEDGMLVPLRPVEGLILVQPPFQKPSSRAYRRSCWSFQNRNEQISVSFTCFRRLTFTPRAVQNPFLLLRSFQFEVPATWLGPEPAVGGRPGSTLLRRPAMTFFYERL